MRRVAKTDELIAVPFWTWTRGGAQGTMCQMGGFEGHFAIILGHARGRYSRRYSRGAAAMRLLAIGTVATYYSRVAIMHDC